MNLNLTIIMPFTDNLPPGVSNKDIEGLKNCNCWYCGRNFESEQETDICPKCERKFGSLDD